MKAIKLEVKDIKLLRRRTIIQLVFLIYLSILTTVIIGFAAYLYFFQSEPQIGLAMVGASAIMLYVVNSIYHSWRKLKNDLFNDVKSAVQGVITNKHSSKNNYQFTINEEKYQVVGKYYYMFEKGQSVLIAFAPMSKILLDIHEFSEAREKV